MTTTNLEYEDDGDPAGREYSVGLAALEKHLADAAAPAPVVPGAGPVDETQAAEGDRGPGVTRRVRRRVAEHDEAHRLLELESDTAPFEVTSERVRGKRKAVNEAAALWQLDRDPRVLAYRDARMRRLITWLALVSLTLALAWSTAGVQAFAAEGAVTWEPRWWFAWLVEPFCSLALLMVVGGRAYLTTRGYTVREKSLDRAEWVFLALTLGMNAWPHLPGVAAAFTVSSLVLHLLGPVIAVAVVRCLPRLLAAFNALALAATTEPEGEPEKPAPIPAAVVAAPVPAPEPATRPAAPARRRPAVRQATRSTVPEPSRRSFDQLRADFDRALETRPAGFDPDNAESIRRTLKCGKKPSRDLRDEYRRRVSGD